MEEKKMARFRKDFKDAQAGNEIEVLTKRKEELDRLYREGRVCKNSFRMKCIAQEYARLRAEYDKIDALF